MCGICRDRGNLGDLVMRVCADILQVPIVIITSLESFPYTTFVPDGAIVTSSVYLAFNAAAPGHYDATQSVGKCSNSYYFLNVSCLLPKSCS